MMRGSRQTLAGLVGSPVLAPASMSSWSTTAGARALVTMIRISNKQQEELEQLNQQLEAEQFALDGGSISTGRRRSMSEDDSRLHGGAWRVRSASMAVRPKPPPLPAVAVVVEDDEAKDQKPPAAAPPIVLPPPFFTPKDEAEAAQVEEFRRKYMEYRTGESRGAKGEFTSQALAAAADAEVTQDTTGAFDPRPSAAGPPLPGGRRLASVSDMLTVLALFTFCLGGWALEYVHGFWLPSFEHAFNSSKAEVGVAGSVSLAAGESLGSIFAGFLTMKFGARACSLVGMVLTSSGLLLASFSTALWHLYPTYGILVGVGAGLSFYGGLIEVTTRFVRSSAVATAVGQVGSGLGGIIIGAFGHGMLQSYGWRGLLRYWALIDVFLIGAGALLLGDMPGVPSCCSSRCSSSSTKRTKKKNSLTTINALGGDSSASAPAGYVMVTDGGEGEDGDDGDRDGGGQEGVPLRRRRRGNGDNNNNNNNNNNNSNSRTQDTAHGHDGTSSGGREEKVAGVETEPDPDPDPDEAAPLAPAPAAAAAPSAESPSAGRMVASLFRVRAFVLLCAVWCLASFSLYVPSQYLTLYSRQLGYSAPDSYRLSMWFGVGSIVRVVPCFVADLCNAGATVMALLSLLLGASTCLVPVFGPASYSVLAIYSGCSGCCVGALMALFGPVVARSIPPRLQSVTPFAMTVAFAGGAIGLFAGGPMAGVIADAMGGDVTVGAFVVPGVILCLTGLGYAVEPLISAVQRLKPRRGQGHGRRGYDEVAKV